MSYHAHLSISVPVSNTGQTSPIRPGLVGVV